MNKNNHGNIIVVALIIIGIILATGLGVGVKYYQEKLIKKSKVESDQIVDTSIFLQTSDICGGNDNPGPLFYYGKDKNGVYCGDPSIPGNKIQGADSSTFVPISSATVDYYAKDKNYVYKNGQILQNADPQTFEFLIKPFNSYQKDRNNVYFKGIVIQGADPVTFQGLGYDAYSHIYAKDKNNVYINETILSGADSATFQVIDNVNSTFQKDKNNVYYQGIILKGADSINFEVLNFGYAKDKNNVYYFNGSVIKNADPTSFQILDIFNAKDKNNIYYKGNITGANQ